MITMFLNLAFLSIAFTAEVEDSDERWHNMGKNSRLAYEWLYFDIHAPDGNSISFVFLGPNPFDIDIATLFSLSGIKKHVGVMAQATAPTGQRFEVLDYTRKNDIKFNASPYHLKINQSTLSMEKLPNGLPEYILELDAVDRYTGMKIKAHLILTSLMRGWKHKEGYVYSDGLATPKKYHKWVVSVPKGVVSGTYEFISKRGESLHHVTLDKASGYHDHNYGTLPLSDTTDGWYWGRAQIGDKTLIYTKVFGKSKPAFFGDINYKKNPPSTLMFMATEQEVLVDSDKMKLEDFGPQNMVVLSNGMTVPKSYQMKFQDLNSEWYQLDVKPTTPLNLSTPFYSRQGGILSLCKRDQCQRESSETLISEQISYPRFLQIVLGLPKP